MICAIGLWTFVRALLVGSPAVALEYLTLRHPLLVLQRSVSRPRLAMEGCHDPGAHMTVWARRFLARLKGLDERAGRARP